MSTTLYWKPALASVESSGSIRATIAMYTDAGMTTEVARIDVFVSPSQSSADMINIARDAVTQECKRLNAVATASALVPNILGYAGGSVTA